MDNSNPASIFLGLLQAQSAFGVFALTLYYFYERMCSLAHWMPPAPGSVSQETSAVLQSPRPACPSLSLPFSVFFLFAGWSRGTPLFVCPGQVTFSSGGGTASPRSPKPGQTRAAVPALSSRSCSLCAVGDLAGDTQNAAGCDGAGVGHSSPAAKTTPRVQGWSREWPCLKFYGGFSFLFQQSEARDGPLITRGLQPLP